MTQYREMRPVTALAVLLILVGSRIVARATEPARLNIDEIIKGIEDNQKVWSAQKNWMVKYTHTRERINPPPGKMVEFPDVELTNARRGKMLAIYHRQPLVNGTGMNEAWLLWDGRIYTERNGFRAYRQDTISQDVLSYFWYPMTLMRDMISEFYQIPEEAFQRDRELAMILPYCLKANKNQYHVRPELEEIDGIKCHVLERPGRDILWISAECGFNVCRRTLYQQSGDLLSEFKATGFKEYARGIWLPRRQLAVAYNNDSDPQEFRRRLRFVMINNLREARFGDIPDSIFQIPLPANVIVEDRRKNK
jgi:hypothetical protein